MRVRKIMQFVLTGIFGTAGLLGLIGSLVSLNRGGDAAGGVVVADPAPVPIEEPISDQSERKLQS